LKPQSSLLPDLFRTEYSKLVARLCSRFGLANIQLAEDIVSDVFLLAVETWGKKGVPANQVAWLYKVAQNRTLDYLRRDKVRVEKVEVALSQSLEESVESDFLLDEPGIADSELQMMFALCHPSLDEKSHLILSLKILCGFANQEIATALLTNIETVNKRLYRAKKLLRTHKIELEYPPKSQMEIRLATVLKMIYLLFNEGYYSASNAKTIRKDLCLRALRLGLLLSDSHLTPKVDIHALIALMCFHSSRLGARVDKEEEMILYKDQQMDLWDTSLIQKGEYFLSLASEGNKISRYHLEAAIAYWHTQAETPDKWMNILRYYNLLLQVEYSPMAALNRTVAYSKVHGPKPALEEALKLDLTENYFYFLLLGHLHMELNTGQAEEYFEEACQKARTPDEKAIAASYLAEGLASEEEG